MRFVLPLFIAVAACSPSAAQKQDNLPFAIAAVATFDEPWAMTFLPGRGVPMTAMALITEKSGKLWLYGTSGGTRTAVAGAPQVDEDGQGGFGDVVAHPGFAGNGMIYLSWVEAGPRSTRGAVVGRAKLIIGSGPPRLEGLTVIWRQSPKTSGTGHFGHRIAFGPDGLLYISSGERQKFDPAQDMRANLGKIVRLNDDGTPAAGNPFAAMAGAMSSSPGAMQEIWSKGHRNPLGLAFDADGRLWDSEMGPQGGDEVNLVIKGANYGWPRVSNGSHYGGAPIPDHAPDDGFEPPKVFWNPSISPSSLMIYSGALFPAWRGDAFVGALSGEALIRVDLDGERARIADTWAMNTRIREVEQGPDGAIWLIEDGGSGRLMKLTPTG